MSLISSAFLRRATASVAAFALFATPISPAFAQVDASSTPATSTASTVDTTAPVITLLGDATMNLAVGDAWTDPGATALDETDGDLTASIVTTGSVDTSAAGTSTIAYDVSDAAGNKAAEVTRTIVVTAPVTDATTTDDDTATTTDSSDDNDAPTFAPQFFSESLSEPTPTTVNVTPSNLHDWYLYDDQTDTAVSDDVEHGFVTGPGTAPEGTGSVHLTKTNTDKYGIATNDFAGTALSDITALSYSTYRTSGTSAQAPSLGFDVDSDTTDGDTDYQGRLTYEPYFTQTVNSGEWQTWDATADTGSGNWWFNGYHGKLSGGVDVGTSACIQSNPCTWTELLAAYPHASIAGRFILRTNGADGEAADMNVDNLRLATASADTTYDFDPDPVIVPSLAITAPAADGDTASGTYDFTADYENGVTTSLQWAVKTDPACNSGTIAGNVDGHHDASTLSGADFSASLDTTAWTNGPYCFVVNDGHGHRVTRHFSVDNAAPDTESPTVTVTPVAGSVLHGIETFDITVSDNEPLDPAKNGRVWVYIYNGGGTSGANVDLSSGHATVDLDTTKLSDGAATLDVGVVSDAAGNPTRDQYHPNGIDSYFSGYVVDNTGPVVTVVPAAGSTLSGTVTFTVTVTDPHLDPSVLGHIWTYLYNNLPPQASKGASLDLSSGTGTFTVDTTQLANGTSTLDVGKLYDALGNPSGAGDSYFKNYVISNYTFDPSGSKFTANPEYVRAHTAGDAAAIALVPAQATAARFTFTQTDGTNVYADVAGAEHTQAGQFPVPSTGQHQYRAGVDAEAGAYAVTGEYEVGSTWYPITGSSVAYALGTPTGDFITPSATTHIFRPGDNPLRIEANDANDTFADVVFNVNGTNYEVDRAACDLREAGGRVICDISSASNWSGLPNGTYTATATLYNLARNHAAITSPSFTVSDSVPVVTSFMATPAAAVYAASLEVSADATDAIGIKDVDFYITAPRIADGVCDGNGAKLADADVTSGSGSTYSTTFDTSGFNGDYCVNVVAGNVIAAHSHPQSIKVAIDTTAPTVPQNGTPNESVLTTNDFDFAWDASSDASGPVTYEYQATQNPAETDGVLTNNLWHSPVLTTPSIHSSGAADGMWYWQVRAKDAAGNYSDWSPIWNVTLDTTAPAAPALFSPADGATVNGASVTQEWSDADPTVDHYVYESYDDAAATSLRFTGTYTTTSKTATSIGDTTYWWRVAAVDAAGNQSAWSPLWQLTVDNASGHGHPTNTPPVADNQAVETTQDEAVDIALIGSDADGDTFSFATTSSPAHGTLSGAIAADGTGLVYTPDAGFTGTDSFTFTANDGTDDSATATVTVTVDPSTDSTAHHFSAKSKSLGTSGGSVLGAETFNFTRDLTIGSTGDDVTALQQILIDAGILNIPAPTGYFGPLTRAALAFFQSLHGIVPAVGYFGPITRALLNSGSY